MRIWSISPEYLDVKRLTAQWREALLCRNVIKGLTKGYKNHPQFKRIEQHNNALDFINAYLLEIWKEADKRGYKYDKSKLENFNSIEQIEVTYDQAWYEFEHLQHKIEKSKDIDKYFENQNAAQSDGSELQLCSLFKMIPGKIQWFEKPIKYNETTYEN